MSPVRSTRTRFRQFIFREMQRSSFTSQVEIVLAKQVVCDKNVIIQANGLNWWGAPAKSLRAPTQRARLMV